MLTGAMPMEHLTKNSLKSMAKEHIYNLIRDGGVPPGGRLPSQRELARTLKISPRVAELALNDLEHEKIIFRKIGKGTFLVDQKNSICSFIRCNQTVTVVVPTLKNPVFSAFVEDVENILACHELKTLVMTTPSLLSNQGAHLKALRDEGSGGIIGITLPTYLYEFASGNGICTVNVSTKRCEGNCNAIMIDLKAAAELIAKHILRSGCKFVVCAGCFPFDDRRCLDERFKALELLLKGQGVKVKIIPQEETQKNFSGNYECIGRQLVERIIESTPSQSSLVFFNDARAMGAIKTLQKMGFSIPGDYSVFGFDNIFSSNLINPALTTVDLGYSEAAKLACDMLISGKSGLEMTITPRLIIRDSTI